MSQPLNISKFGKNLNINPSFIKVLTALERFLRFPQINKLYSDTIKLYNSRSASSSFFDAVLQEMNVTVEVNPVEYDRIPDSGPLVVVSNHPYGGIDGLALGAILAKARPDFKLMVNSFLDVFEEMSPWLFKVDVLKVDSGPKNILPLLNCARFLKAGNCLGVFPAGEVSSISLENRQVEDRAWSVHPIALARMTSARILPIYFSGRNSNLFQLLGLVHPIFRTLLLSRELWNKRGLKMKVRVGEPIPIEKIKSFENDALANEYCRVSVEALAKTEPFLPPFPRTRPFFFGNRKTEMKTIISGVDPKKLENEVSLLDESSLMAKKGDFEVYCFRAHEAPSIMREIARLREQTFRKVGEGTGKSLDQDKFDEWYFQLFAWDRANKKVAGGYRLGVATEIIPEKGKEGMYATSEFSLRKGFYKALGNAVEVGRSFITEEYQRKFLLLGLIWQGIGEFMNRRPKHFILYGPVSISSDYSQLSRNLMVSFLRTNRWSTKIAKRAKAKNPFRAKALSPTLHQWVQEEGRSLEDVSAVISSAEPDGKGIPVLVKHYLRLKGSFVGFAVDPKFNDALDGLIVVDIRNMEDKQLVKYFGLKGKDRAVKARNERDFAIHEAKELNPRNDRVPFLVKRDP